MSLSFLREPLAKRLSAITLALGLLRSTAAQADECPRAGHPFIEVLVEVEPPDRFIAVSLVKHLRAELTGRGIDVCEQAALRSQLARVKLHVKRDTAGAVVAQISLEDTLLKKEVTRELDLTALPDDARPLTVATATDELLRAAWAELALSDSPTPAAAPPKEVVDALRSSFREPPVPAPATVAEIGLVGAGSASRQRTAAGAGLLGYTWLSPRVGLASRILGSHGFPLSSAHGEARIDSLSFGFGPVFSPFSSHENSGLRLEPLVSATFARSSADAGPNALSQQGTAGTIELSAGASGWLRAGPIALTAGLAVSYPLRAVRATDEQSVVTAIEGPAGTLSIGLLFVR